MGMLSWHDLAEWLVRVALGGGLVLLLAWLVLRWVTEPARRQRLGEWSVAAALLLAVLCLAPGWLALPVLPHDAPTNQATVPLALNTYPSASTTDGNDSPDDEDAPDPLEGGAVTEAMPTTATTLPLTPPTSRTPSSGDWWRANWAIVLLGAWGGGALFFVGRLLLARWALRRYCQRAVAVPTTVQAQFTLMAADITRARVLMCRHLPTPFSFGLWTPTVVLPAGLCEPGAEHRLQWVLAHEVAHLRRRDAQTCFLFNLAQPLFWFLPWFWSLRHQVELCQEFLADEATVQTCAELPTDYADFLLRWARRSRVPAGALGVWGRPSDLYRRITMLLNRSRSLEAACPRHWSWVFGTSLLTLACVLGSLTLTAATATPLPAGALTAEVKADSDETGDAPQTDPVPEIKPPVTPNPDEKKPARRRPQPGPPPPPPKVEDLVKNLAKNIDPKQVQAAKEQFESVVKVAADQLQKHIASKQVENQNRQARTRATLLGASLIKPNPGVIKYLELPTDQGLLVEDLRSDSLAAQAGLKVYDVLLEIDGQKVPSDIEAFQKLLKTIKPGTMVELVIQRKQQRETLANVKLAEPPTEPRSSGRRQGGFRMGGLSSSNTPASLQRRGNTLTARQTINHIGYTVTGKLAGNAVTVERIEIKEASGVTTYEHIDEVPEVHRDRVRKLILATTGNRGAKQYEF